MPQLHTARDLRETIMQGLHQLFNQDANSSNANFELYEAQQNLLFMSLFDGIVHNMQLEYQDKYLWDKKMRTHLSTGDQWTVQLIKFLWDFLLSCENKK